MRNAGLATLDGNGAARIAADLALALTEVIRSSARYKVRGLGENLVPIASRLGSRNARQVRKAHRLGQTPSNSHDKAA